MDKRHFPARGLVSLPADLLIERIERGDRVTYWIPAGIGRNGPERKEFTSRCVIPTNRILGPTSNVVCFGHAKSGAYPHVVDATNIIRVGRFHASHERTPNRAHPTSPMPDAHNVKPTEDAKLSHMRHLIRPSLNLTPHPDQHQ
jgi:hypothetical protein